VSCVIAAPPSAATEASTPPDPRRPIKSYDAQAWKNLKN